MKHMNQISKLATLSLMTALLANCSSSNVGSKNSEAASGIINGREAHDTDVATGGMLNSVVGILSKIEMKDENGKTVQGAAICTGTLIAQDMILTAGHCLQGVKAQDVIIFLQAEQMSRDATRVAVKNFVVKTEYAKSGSSKDDLAVIQLAAPAPASVKPMALASASLDIVNAPKAAAGYGQSDDRRNTPSGRDGTGILRYTMVMDGSVVVDSSVPRLGGMIMANSALTGTCHGDSGGPLMALDPATHQLLLVGVTEAGAPIYQGQQGKDFDTAASDPTDPKKAVADFYEKYPDAHMCGGADLFVNVAQQTAWINQAMADLKAGKAQ